MKKGTYLDTDEKTYRAWPGINYSSLSRFSESQDHCLMPWPAKSYYEEGTAFELLIEDRAKGTAKFAERFFLADAPGAMPDGLAGWIDEGKDLGNLYTYTQKGELHGGKKRLHAWLDACRDHPGMMPMGKDQMVMLNKMVDNFMLMELYGHPLSKILAIADFQVPIIWEASGIKKKALVDVLIQTKDKTYAFDIKTAADIYRFKSMLRNKYWIQDVHYSEGVAMVCNNPMPFMFLVSSKAEPFLAQPFGVDPDSREYAKQEYAELCNRFVEWDESGRPAKGWKGYEEIRIYFS